MRTWLDGKKTILGSLLLSLLGACWSLDVLIDGTANWLSEQQYVAIGTTIAGLTGAALRLALDSTRRPKADGDAGPAERNASGQGLAVGKANGGDGAADG